MSYQIVETSKGLSNFLKIYKAQMVSLGLKPGSKVAYIGCAGTCLPFIELFAFVLREAQVEQVFIPDGIVEETRSLGLVSGIGIQVGGMAIANGADLVVLFGGISMPQCTIGIEGTNEAIGKIMKPGGKVIGVCFMSMFEKAGWYGKVPFDTVIDAGIEPINVQKF
jgi:hypothetical protein